MGELGPVDRCRRSLRSRSSDGSSMVQNPVESGVDFGGWEV
jgi:hypothetical protein